MGTKKRSRLLVLFKKTLCLPKLFPLFRQIFWRLEAYSSNELTKLDINFWNPLPYRNAGKCPQLPQRPACTLTYVYEKIYALQKLLQEVFLAYIHHLKAWRVYTLYAISIGKKVVRLIEINCIQIHIQTSLFNLIFSLRSSMSTWRHIDTDHLCIKQTR